MVVNDGKEKEYVVKFQLLTSSRFHGQQSTDLIYVYQMVMINYNVLHYLQQLWALHSFSYN